MNITQEELTRLKEIGVWIEENYKDIRDKLFMKYPELCKSWQYLDHYELFLDDFHLSLKGEITCRGYVDEYLEYSIPLDAIFCDEKLLAWGKTQDDERLAVIKMIEEEDRKQAEKAEKRNHEKEFEEFLRLKAKFGG